MEKQHDDEGNQHKTAGQPPQPPQPPPAPPLNGDCPPDDPFDPSQYARPQDSRLAPGTDLQSIGSIYCGKPKADWFFRSHPSQDYRAMLPLYSDTAKSKNGGLYLWSRGLEIPASIADLIRPHLVAACVNNSGVPFLYAILESETDWYTSAVSILKESMTHWRRQTSDRVAGEYVGQKPDADCGEPKFPDVPFRMYIERAFRKHIITSLDDPVVKRIRGIQ